MASSCWTCNLNVCCGRPDREIRLLLHDQAQSARITYSVVVACCLLLRGGRRRSAATQQLGVPKVQA